MARYVLIPKFAAETGYTIKAVEKKIEDGIWTEPAHYRRRGGRIHMDVEGYERWVESQQPDASKSGPTASGSRSH